LRSPNRLGMDGGKLAILFLCMSVAVNVILTRQLSRARAEVQPELFPLGERATPIAFVATNGVRSTYEFGRDSVPTFIYWFRPSCSWCEANLPYVEALARQSGGRYKFLPVSDASPAELARYLKSHRLGFPLYTISPVSVAQYRFRGTPASLLISARGVITKGWQGAYRPSTLIELEKVLGIKLPDLAASAQRGLRQ